VKYTHTHTLTEVEVDELSDHITTSHFMSEDKKMDAFSMSKWNRALCTWKVSQLCSQNSCQTTHGSCGIISDDDNGDTLEQLSNDFETSAYRYRASCVRDGKHAFQSMDYAKALGDVIGSVFPNWSLFHHSIHYPAQIN
jgi:hypothetical protein